MKCPLFGTMSGPCFTMLKSHLAYIYFQMSQSSENFKTESIRSKEYVYGVSNFWDSFGPSLDQVGTMFSLPLLLLIFLSNLSVFWFSHILTQVLQWRSCRPLVLLPFQTMRHLNSGECYTEICQKQAQLIQVKAQISFRFHFSIAQFSLNKSSHKF